MLKKVVARGPSKQRRTMIDMDPSADLRSLSTLAAAAATEVLRPQPYITVGLVAASDWLYRLSTYLP